MLELSEPIVNPALMAAQLAALVSRTMFGRKVDVLLSAQSHAPAHPRYCIQRGALAMTVEPAIVARLQLLARALRKECQHLATTDQRLLDLLGNASKARDKLGWTPKISSAGMVREDLKALERDEVIREDG
jgi:hypothetical protein